MCGSAITSCSGNSVGLAGHVVIEDWADISPFSGVHQFCRIGRHAFIGPYSVVKQDVMPFSLTSNKPELGVFGANSIGLERRGFGKGAIEALQTAFRLLTRSRAEYHPGDRADPRRGPGVPRSGRAARVHPLLGARCDQVMRYGLIAGNGRFPLLALESAQRLGHEVTVIAIQEEASAGDRALAPRCHWISLGELSRLIEISKRKASPRW